MAFKTRYFIYTARNFQTGLTDVVAKVRRNGVYVLGADVTPLALTELDNGRYQLTLNDAQFTAAGGAGDYQIDVDSATKSAPATLVREITENDPDTIYTFLAAVDAKIDIIDANVDQALLDIADVKTVVDNINSDIDNPTTGLVNIKALIDQIISITTNISNVTRFSAPIPKQMIRQDVGTKSYVVPIRLFDNAGNPEAPDGSLTVSVKNSAGTDRTAALINGAIATQHVLTPSSPGIYSMQIDVEDTEILEPLQFIFEYTENSVALSQVATSEIVEEVQLTGLALEATAQSILTDTADMQPRVADIQSVVNNVTYGLAALKTLIDTIDSVVDANNTELVNGTYGLSAIKTILDGKASQASVTAIQTVITDDVKGAGFVQAEDTLHQISSRIYSGGSIA